LPAGLPTFHRFLRPGREQLQYLWLRWHIAPADSELSLPGGARCDGWREGRLL